MKKTAYLLIALFGLGFASCKKCQTCVDCPLNIGNGEYCKDDFDNTDDYNAAIADLEAYGCECK